MKRIYILLLVCMGTMSVMAQGQKLKNRIIDKDHYPVDSAKVTVKGTNISTTTDKNGNFVLENVPLALDSLQVQKGKKDYAVTTPVYVEMRTAVMDRFSWYVKAGVDFNGLLGDVNMTDGIGFHAGAGLDIKMTRHWAFQPALYLTYRKMVGETGHNYSEGNEYFNEASSTYEIGCFEVPLLFALKIPVSRSVNLQIQLGAYLGIGLWGDRATQWAGYGTRYDEYGNAVSATVLLDTSTDIFGKRFTGGAAYGIGLEIGHILVGASGRTGYSSWDYGEGFTSVSIEVGYKF